MLIINIEDFNLEEFIEEITSPEGTYDPISHTFSDGRGGYCIRVRINGRYVINDPNQHIEFGCQGFMLYITLKSLNNAFYNLLTGAKEANIIIDWGSGGSQRILVEKVGDKALFTTAKSRFKFDNYVAKEPVDFVQACEEVLRAVNYYKNICLDAAHKVVPNDVSSFMNKLFGEKKETQKSDLSRFSEEEQIVWRNRAEEWLPLEDALREYKKNRI